jgi:hypothetical protein
MEWHLCISFTQPRPVSDLVGFFIGNRNGVLKKGNWAAAWTKCSMSKLGFQRQEQPGKVTD